jgi:KUP system potassium uptake protein
MADAGEIDLVSPYRSLHKYSMMADFKFVILQSWASSDSEISNLDRLIIQGYRILKRFSLSTEEHYGIEEANLEIEKAPIQVGPPAKIKIKRDREDEKRNPEKTNTSSHSKHPSQPASPP